MAVTITENQTYDSGSSYLVAHTWTDVNVSGSDTLHIAMGINRNPASDVTGWTSDGSAMVSIADSINANTVSVQTLRYTINNADVTTVCNTPSYKLQAGIVVGLAGVDQTTPIAGSTTAGTWNTTATAAYTGTSGNLLIVCISTQNDKTFTVSNCTEISSLNGSDANLGGCFMGYVTATGSSQTIGATFTGDDNWRLVIFEVTVASEAAAAQFMTPNKFW